METPRKIIHCDCDCFYASVEMRDNPELRGKPLAVGGSPRRRGVIATCNYEARQFGIHSAMASATARKRCPQLIIVKPDMEKYRRVSQQIHEIFQRFTDIIEPLSLDEAYLDVSNCTLHDGSATRIAEAMRREVREELGITISAGVAPNKFLAKIASDWNKPDGLFVILPDAVQAFVTALPVRKLHGVGKVTATRMKKLGIETCGDLQALEEAVLQQHFGSFGDRLSQLSHGIDPRPVQTDRIRKSVSVENTYAEDLPDADACLSELPALHAQLQKRLRNLERRYRIDKQFVKIKFNDFVQTTVETLSDDLDMAAYVDLLRQGFTRGNKPVRLLGLGVRVSPVAAGRESGQRQLALELQA
jgi:DNA polymerase-4